MNGIFILVSCLVIAFSQVQVHWLAHAHMKTGKLNIITQGNPLSSKLNISHISPTYTYPVSFSYTFKKKPLIVFGIISLQLKSSAQNTSYFFRNQIDNNTLSTTSYNHLLTLGSIQNNFKQLVVLYLAVDPTEVAFLGIQYFTRDPSDSTQVNYMVKNIKTGSGKRVNTFDGVTTQLIKSTHQYGQLMWLQSIGFTIGKDGLFLFGMEMKTKDQRTYSITFWTQGDCKITYVEPNFMNFDKTVIEQAKNYFTDFGHVEAKNGKTVNSNLVNVIQKIQSAFLMGIYYIKLNTFSNQMDFSINQEVPFQTSTLTNFAQINYTYFNFRIRQCPSTHPYYYQDEQLCYQKCPSTTYLNATYQFCFLCGYTCETCPNASFCSTCDPLSFRVMNSKYQCQCMSGYYDDNITTKCIQCMIGCTSCSIETTCKTCNASEGYKLQSGKCVCSKGYHINQQGICETCSSKMFGCGQCSNQNTCLSCLSTTNYSYSSNICSCNQNYYPKDDLCVDCGNVIVGCMNCVSGEECSECNTQMNFHLNENKTCSCQDGYFVYDPTLSCSLCSSVIVGCFLCQNEQTCTECIQPLVVRNFICGCENISEYLNRGDCLSCHDSCLSCNGAKQTNCLDCKAWMVYDQTDHICSCQQRNHINTGQYCLNCSQLCSGNKCTNSSQPNCIKCNCPCLHGFFLNEEDKCQTCNYDSLTSSNSFCTCPSNMYNGTDNNSCKQCYYTCLTCSGPGDTQDNKCTSCDGSLNRQQKETNCPCIELFSDQGETFECVRSVCLDGKSFNQQMLCQIICGDGLVGLGQECDDGNTQNKDGCSSVCKIQEGFICSGNQTTTSQCKFNTPLNISLVSLVKEPTSNNLTYTFNISPAPLQLQNVNFSQIVNLNLPPNSIITYEYNSNGTLTANVQYFESLTNKNTTVVFNPSNYSLMFSSTSQQTINIPIEPQNNLAAQVYSDQVYGHLKILPNLVTTAYSISLGAFALGLVSGKLIGIQMMGIVQLGYVGLILVSLTDPLYQPMSKLMFTNGYSLELDKNSKADLPSRLSSLSYYQLLINNFNVMLAPQIILFIVWVISKLVCKLMKSEDKTKNCKFIGERALGQYLITFVLFSLYQYVISVIILIKYKTQYSSKMFQIGSLVEAAIFGIFLLMVSVIYWFFTKDYFGEYKQFFCQSRFSQSFYYFHIGQRIIIGLSLAMGNGSFYSGIICITYLFAMLLTVAIVRPYKEMKQNIRNIINNICGIGILGVYTFASFYGKSSSESILVYLPYFVIGLILVTAVIGLSFIIIQLFLKIKQWSNKSQQKSPSPPPDNVAAMIANEQQQFQKMVKQRIRKQSDNLNSKKRKRSTASNKVIKIKIRSQQSDLDVDEILSPHKLKSKLLEVSDDLMKSPQRKQSQMIQQKNMILEQDDQIELEPNSSRSFIPLNANKGVEIQKQQIILAEDQKAKIQSALKQQ